MWLHAEYPCIPMLSSHVLYNSCIVVMAVPRNGLVLAIIYSLKFREYIVFIIFLHFFPIFAVHVDVLREPP